MFGYTNKKRVNFTFMNIEYARHNFKASMKDYFFLI